MINNVIPLGGSPPIIRWDPRMKFVVTEVYQRKSADTMDFESKGGI